MPEAKSHTPERFTAEDAKERRFVLRYGSHERSRHSPGGDQNRPRNQGARKAFGGCPSAHSAFGLHVTMTVELPILIFREALELAMRVYSAVIERCSQTGLFVGFIPGFPGAHSQGETLDEANNNLHDVIAMLLEDGEPVLESEFVGIQNVAIA